MSNIISSESFFFLYDLSKGLRNGVVSIPLSSSIPSAS
jgi:hypothetical protein